MLSGTRNRFLYFLFLGVLSLCQPAVALTLTPEASAGLKYSNNPLLRESNLEGSWVLSTYAAAVIEEHSKRFSMAANTSIRSESYSNGDINVDDKYYFNFGLSSRVDVIQRKFSFLINNSFRQTLIDTSNPRIPDNIQDTNVFTFGADIKIPLTARQRLVFSPRVRDFYYEATDADNKQYSSTLGWSYAVNPLLSFSVNGGVTKVQYDNNELTDSDYMSTDLSVGLSRKQKRSRAAVSVGVTKIRRDMIDDQDGFTGSIGWSRELTGKSSLQINMKSVLRDSSESLVEAEVGQDLDGGLIEPEEEEITRDVLRSNSFRVDYSGRKAISAVNVWAAFNDYDYKETLRDKEVSSLGFQLDYQLMQKIKSSVYGSYRFSDEKDLLREDRLRTFGVLVNYRLSRFFSGSFKLQNSKNKSDLDAAEYAETSVFMSIVYGQKKK